VDERKRIMDLVKKGLISSNEAIVLLEQLGRDSAESTDDDAPFRNGQRTTYQTDDHSNYIENLKRRIEQVKERLTVLNTLDDFERLADDEASERSDLEKSLVQLQSELDKAEKQYRNSQDSNKESFFNIDTDSVEHGFRNFASKFKDCVKNFSDNFELHDFSIKVPGFARSKKIINTYEYAQNEIKILNIKNFNGDVIIRKSADDRIHERITYRVLGNIRNSSAEEFFKNNTANEVNGSTLAIKMPPRIESTIELSFPTDFRLSSVNLRSGSGNFYLSNLNTDDLAIVSSSGTINLKTIVSDHIEANNANGSIVVSNCTLLSGFLSAVNGSIRTSNSVNNLEFSSVNGSVVLSNISKNSENISTHVINGDIKVSVPLELGYLIKAESKNGEIYNRLTNVTINTNHKNYKSSEFEHIATGHANIQLTTISGSIYLKDGNSEEENHKL
jgi:DUF4097 and DUF4098 domain-containing protein YvlB